MKNCNPHIERYMKMVETGEIRACDDQKKLIKLVKNAFKNEKIHVDNEQFEHYLSLAQYFPYDKLFEWEAFCLGLHMCTYWDETGLPRWPDLLCLIGRGAGKDGYIAFESTCAISPYNGIEEYDVDICANNESQALRPVKDIVSAFEHSKFKKKLEKFFSWLSETIKSVRNFGVISGHTNNPGGKDGLRSGMVIFNEIHQYVKYANIDVFTTGLGKKPHPRRGYYTTQGDIRDGVLDDLLETSARILNGEIPDNGLLPFICRLNSIEDVHDEKNWQMANPSIMYNPSLYAEIKKEYNEWVENPDRLPGFLTKRMNIPQERKDMEVTTWENILKTNRPLPDLKGKTCVCGIDFAKTTDLISAVLLFKEKETYYAIHHSWFCLRSNDRHRIKFPLKDMVDLGILTMVDDVEVHPSLITKWIDEKRHIYDINMIAVDDYRYALISRELKEIGYEAKDKKVKMVRPSDIMKIQPKIDSVLTGGRLIAGDDPMFRWAINNAKLEPAPNNNFKYGKIEGKSRKTDPFMAYVAAMTIEDQLPETSEMVFFDPIVF